MYARDYHPDENMVFKTKNYGFTSPKSTPLDPVANMAIQIDDALKNEATVRATADRTLDAKIDKEITDRENADLEIINKVLHESQLNIQAVFSGLPEVKVTYPAYQIGNTVYTVAWLYQSQEQTGTFTIWLPNSAQNIRGLNRISFANSEGLMQSFACNRDQEKDTANYIAYSTAEIPAAHLSPLPTTAQLITFTI